MILSNVRFKLVIWFVERVILPIVLTLSMHQHASDTDNPHSMKQRRWFSSMDIAASIIIEPPIVALTDCLKNAVHSSFVLFSHSVFPSFFLLLFSLLSSPVVGLID